MNVDSTNVGLANVGLANVGLANVGLANVDRAIEFSVSEVSPVPARSIRAMRSLPSRLNGSVSAGRGIALLGVARR